MTQTAAGLEFPCAYPVKVMVRSGDDARAEVLSVIAAHAPGYSADEVRIRASRNGRFESMTVTVQAQTREQLEQLYQALSDLEVVKMLL